MAFYFKKRLIYSLFIDFGTNFTVDLFISLKI